MTPSYWLLASIVMFGFGHPAAGIVLLAIAVLQAHIDS